MAAIFAGIAVLTSLVLAVVFMPAGLFNAGGGIMMIGFAIGIAVVYLVAAWFFFGFGAKNMMKAKPR